MYFYLFIYLFEREREHEHAWAERGKERGRERIPSRLHTVRAEPDVGLKLTNHEIITWAKTIMTWAENKSWTQPTKSPRCPSQVYFKRTCFLLLKVEVDYKWQLGSDIQICHIFANFFKLHFLPFSERSVVKSLS